MPPDPPRGLVVHQSDYLYFQGYTTGATILCLFWSKQTQRRALNLQREELMLAKALAYIIILHFLLLHH